MTQEHLAQALKITRSSVHQWEKGLGAPKRTRMKEVAELLQVDLQWLLSDNDAPAAPLHSFAELSDAGPAYRPGVPVISYVQAGEWTEIRDDLALEDLEYLQTDQKLGPGAFALIVEGLSMVPQLLPGDKIIVDPQALIRPGDLVVAQIDGEVMATVKQYRDRGKDAQGRPIIELAPANPNYPTLRIDAEHPGRIIGKVVERRSYPGAAAS